MASGKPLRGGANIIPKKVGPPYPQILDPPLICVSTSFFEGVYTCWQRRSLPPVKCSTIQKHITPYKMWNGTCKQRILPKWPYVTIAPFYTSGECTTKVSSGRYAWNVSWKLSEVISFPTWLWLDCTWKWYSHLGDVQPRASSKVLDIVKCFCKSTTLYITKRCRLRKHGCPCMVHFRAPVHRFVLITLKWL